jgi:hypothetical protein
MLNVEYTYQTQTSKRLNLTRVVKTQQFMLRSAEKRLTSYRTPETLNLRYLRQRLRELWLLSRPYLEVTETSPAQKCLGHKYIPWKNKRIKRELEMESPTIIPIWKKKLTSINNFWQDRTAGIRSAGQNISHVLRHKTVHNHGQNKPPLASSRNHQNSVHTLKTPFKSTLILSLCQFLRHKGGLFPSGFATKVLWIQLQLKGHSMSTA